MNFPKKSFYCAFCCLLILGLSAPNFGAMPSPTPEQIAAFQGLDPAQQKQLAAQFGVQIEPTVNNTNSRSVEPVVSVKKRQNEEKIESEHIIGSLGNSGPNMVDRLSKDDAVLPFGYDLFAGEPTTYEPVSDVPVSTDYVLGVGDTLKVQLYGKESDHFELRLDAEGRVHIPSIGPIALLGMSFSEAKDEILSQVSRRKIGVKATVLMGQLKAIRVFVLGEAYKPGSYVMSSLSTITNALVLSGGIAETGSLRNVQLKRRGNVVGKIDLYQLLLGGDNSNDLSLRSGDVVFIPPVGKRVTVKGAVRRPGIYELTDTEGLEDIMRFAGGFSENARLDHARLERIGSGFRRVMSALDLSENLDLQLTAGDVISIPKAPTTVGGSITLLGHFVAPGEYPWFEGMTLKDVLKSERDLLPKPDLGFGLVKRLIPRTGKLEVFSFVPRRVLFGEAGHGNQLEIRERDTVIVFSDDGSSSNKNEVGGRHLVESLVEELRYSASADSVSREVEVTGFVRYPGVYPLTPKMSLKDLLAASGGLSERAFKLSAEVSRTKFSIEGSRQQSRIELNLQDSKSLEFLLEPRDVLQIRSVPEWAETEYVEISGEVRFPGTYPIHKNEMLRDVIRRAGGLTEYAHPEASVFTRESLRRKQQISLDNMRNRLLDDVAKASIAEGDGSEGVVSIERLISQLDSGRALGRLVIDMQQVLSTNSIYSVSLENGDSLFVPAQKNAITVVGEVQMPVSQVFEEGLTVDDYVSRSGGVTQVADESAIYIIKTDGSVRPAEKYSWFSVAKPLEAGDTVVVPLDADRVNQRELWRDVSQIFYQMALGAAAVGSL